ncbi:hypothetical protein CHS0354_031850 [Potamilus streckersoni]|uniref:Uncharacterized protein n=1 Tax=Potamilus streckersoni TaxID=2493646 RepID=A0AAE0RXU1_9BIVA|nr:hypothetical protein CHS0354_031850 [Potamilus streckersoni]
MMLGIFETSAYSFCKEKIFCLKIDSTKNLFQERLYLKEKEEYNLHEPENFAVSTSIKQNAFKVVTTVIGTLEYCHQRTGVKNVCKTY